MLCAGPPNHGLGPFRGPQAQNYARATVLVVSASTCERDSVQCGCPSIPRVPRGVYLTLRELYLLVHCLPGLCIFRLHNPGLENRGRSELNGRHTF